MDAIVEAVYEAKNSEANSGALPGDPIIDVALPAIQNFAARFLNETLRVIEFVFVPNLGNGGVAIPVVIGYRPDEELLDPKVKDT